MGKVFERLILNRWIPRFSTLGIPNPFQFAYQANKSCVLASFILQETIYYNVERGSKVYCCFLDSSKAFDTVWLDGLFYKLFNIGMKGKSWRILKSWYNKMSCCVSLGGKISPMFPIKQGVRQGGVLSPWLFLCYNNDIPDLLTSTGRGVTIQEINCSSVLVADDITLMSTLVCGLQSMLDAIVNYSNQWRFVFNPDKTTVVTFGESTRMYKSRKKSRQWFLGDVAVSEKSSWDHVGITLTGNFSSTERSRVGANKGRSVVGALMGAGVRPGGLNPICGANIWKSFGIPSMLYGCELWSNLTVSENQVLNRTTVFAAKRLQGLPITTHSAGALGTIGMWTTSAFIDKAKLLFFGLLCRASVYYLHKIVFIKRLSSYLMSGTKLTLGFIPDAIRLLRLYKLYDHLEHYLDTCFFPSKAEWQRIVVNNIRQEQNNSWREELLTKPGLLHLQRTHRTLQPLVHWSIVRKYPFHRNSVANIVNLLCGNVPAVIMSSIQECDDRYTCKLCNKSMHDISYHFVMDCIQTNQERNDLWESITDLLSTRESSYLYNMDEVEQYETLISGHLFASSMDEDKRDSLLLLVAEAILDIFKNVETYIKDIT